MHDKRNSRGCAFPPCCGMDAIGQIRIVFRIVVVLFFLLLLARDDPLLKRDDDEAMPLRVECCCAANIIPVYPCLVLILLRILVGVFLFS
jgi:hypothetical protein